MLASVLAPHVTGRYTFTFAPVALPEAVVRALLPPHWRGAEELWVELEEVGCAVPDSGDGKRWVCVEAGRQVETGVQGVPGGKSTFLEAKLEIPFLRHLRCPSTSTPVTFKQTMLFSSRLMAFSSANITGLRSHCVSSAFSDASYEAAGYLELRKNHGVEVEEERCWSEELAAKVLEGWWVGERTGQTATRFSMTSLAPTQPRPDLVVRLNLPTLLQMQQSEVQALLHETGVAMDKDGWASLPSAGFSFDKATRMQATKLSDL
ncbi:hypothetical protein JCM10213_008832 [Rhodosporidiobolus nylandii]